VKLRTAQYTRQSRNARLVCGDAFIAGDLHCAQVKTCGCNGRYVSSVISSSLIEHADVMKTAGFQERRNQLRMRRNQEASWAGRLSSFHAQMELEMELAVSWFCRHLLQNFEKQWNPRMLLRFVGSPITCGCKESTSMQP
jgi:hypothetical protein